MLYQKYLDYFYKNKINTGFSQRLPDFANKFWLNNLEKALDFNNKNVLLDIGAGDGRLSILLSSFFKEILSLEIQVDKKHWDKILLEFKNIKLIEGLLQEKLSYLKNKNVDFILLSEVFEHIPEQDVNNFLIKVKEILNPEGYIFLTTPNFTVQGPAEKSHIWYQKTPYGHHKHYSLKELKDLLIKNNFEIIFHSFECNKLKRVLYNKIFYPIARLDDKLLNSKKLNKNIRLVYKISSSPFIFFIKNFFRLWAKIIFFIEQNFNTVNNSNTIIICAKLK